MGDPQLPRKCVWRDIRARFAGPCTLFHRIAMHLLVRSSDPTDWGQIDAPIIRKERRCCGGSSPTAVSVSESTKMRTIVFAAFGAMVVPAGEMASRIGPA